MSTPIQYLVATLLTVLAWFVCAASSNVVANLGMMMTAGLQHSASPRLRRDLEAGNPTDRAVKMFLRAKLLGAVPGASVMILLAAICEALIGHLTPEANWIPGLFLVIVLLSGLNIIRVSLWWLLKSFFRPAEDVAADIAAWEAKNA